MQWLRQLHRQIAGIVAVARLLGARELDICMKSRRHYLSQCLPEQTGKMGFEVSLSWRHDAASREVNAAVIITPGCRDESPLSG